MNQESEQTTNRYICPFFEKCCFVHDNIERMPELIDRTQERYCRVSEALCARRRLYEALDAEAVPPLLLPEQTDWARQILDECEGGRKNDSQTASAH